MAIGTEIEIHICSLDGQIHYWGNGRDWPMCVVRKRKISNRISDCISISQLYVGGGHRIQPCNSPLPWRHIFNLILYLRV